MRYFGESWRPQKHSFVNPLAKPETEIVTLGEPDPGGLHQVALDSRGPVLAGTGHSQDQIRPLVVVLLG